MNNTIELCDNPTLEEIASAIDKIRIWALFELTASDYALPMVEQYALACINSLEQAKIFATIADYTRMRESKI